MKLSFFCCNYPRLLTCREPLAFTHQPCYIHYELFLLFKASKKKGPIFTHLFSINDVIVAKRVCFATWSTSLLGTQNPRRTCWNEAKRMSLFLSRLCLNVVLLENCNSLFKDASYGIDLGGEGGMVRLGINCCYKQILLITSHFWQSNKFCPNC